MLGTNDVKTEFGLSVDKLIGQWEAFLDDVARYARAATVVLVSPIRIDPEQPRFAVDMVAFDAGSVAKADRFAEAYAALARRRGLLFLDAAGVAAAGADGIHLTGAGHARLADAVAAVILTGQPSSTTAGAATGTR